MMSQVRDVLLALSPLAGGAPRSGGLWRCPKGGVSLHPYGVTSKRTASASPALPPLMWGEGEDSRIGNCS